MLTSSPSCWLCRNGDGASAYVECSKSVTYEFPWWLAMVTQTDSSLYFGTVLGWMMRELMNDEAVKFTFYTPIIHKGYKKTSIWQARDDNGYKTTGKIYVCASQRDIKIHTGRNRGSSVSLTSRGKRTQGDDKLPILTLNLSLSTLRI